MRKGLSFFLLVDALAEREQCEFPYHLGCLEPPLDAVPEGEWFCPKCSEKPGRPIGVDAEEAPEPAAKKRRGKQEGTDEEIEDDVPAKKARGKGEKVSAAAKCKCTEEHGSLYQEC